MSTRTPNAQGDLTGLISNTIKALHELMPVEKDISDEIQDAVFQAIDGVDKDMRALNLAIHGMILLDNLHAWLMMNQKQTQSWASRKC
jgi:hypothetical protein